MTFPQDYVNKIICGDSLEVMKGIPNKSIDLVVTDPPYGMNFVSNYRKEKYHEIVNDTNLFWLPDLIQELYRIVKQDSHLYFFCSHHHIETFKIEIGKCFIIKNILIWHKNNTGMGDLEGDYAPQYEMIIFCSNGVRKLNGRRDSNIIKSKRTGNNLHPTEKPVDIIQFLIGKSSNTGELIFDPFAGSGTTCRASLDLKRNFIGIEISPEYCKIAEDRLKQQILNF